MTIELITQRTVLILKGVPVFRLLGLLFFSSPVWAMCGQATTVNTEAELNDAIACFNFQTPAGDHTISIGQDINTASSTPFESIISSVSGVELVIDSGGGFQRKLTGFGSGATTPLLQISGSSKVTLRNVKLQAATGAAVLVTGDANEVVMDEVDLFDSGTGLRIESGTVYFLRSSSKGNRQYGVQLEDTFSGTTPSLQMEDSEVAFNSSDGVSLTGTDTSRISSSEIHSHFLGNGIVVSDSEVVIEKSTIYASRFNGIKSENSDIYVSNSLVRNNSFAGIDIDNLRNFGSWVDNTGVYDNGTGIEASSTFVELRKSTVYNSTSTGISLGRGVSFLIDSSTISGNGGDGIAAGQSQLDIRNSTITLNAGDGVVGNTSTSFYFSIVAENDTNLEFFSDCTELFGGSYINLGGNFDSDDTCTGFATLPPGQIEAIADNGCATRLSDSFSCVLTHRLLTGSSAIDAGMCDGFKDQRFVTRGSSCDSGAYEVDDALCNGLAVTVDIGSNQSPTSGNDVIRGTEGADVITAFGGDDVICGLGGPDIINAGRGDDWIDAGPGSDEVLGARGEDTIIGGWGSDDLFGGTDDDEIYGGEDDDTIFGNSGNDVIDGNDGVDEIRGGSGDDYISTGSGATVGSGVIVDAGAGNDQIFGGPDADEIRGSTDTDTIYGGGGNDRLFGGGGIDFVYGEDGDDFIRGNANNDTVTGGAGKDNVDGGSGKDIVIGGDNDDFLKGSTGNDDIEGNAGADIINGGGGNDDLRGDSEDDQILGGGSDDNLDGGVGFDNCDGQSGTDTGVSCEISNNIP